MSVIFATTKKKRYEYKAKKISDPLCDETEPEISLNLSYDGGGPYVPPPKCFYFFTKNLSP